ncbi:MAG: hypothetical protein INR65_18730, partial [Gluconacetobacter diazotrophicus]|nr:hypothetical protein [Gluconacetobacter diazotrophicus]
MSVASFPPPPQPTILGYAGFWWRVLAWIVDSLILTVVDVVLGRLTGWRHLDPGLYDVRSDDDAPVAAVAYTWSYAAPIGFPHPHF